MEKVKECKERVKVLGKKFGKLTPYEKTHKRCKTGKSEIYYKCYCDCGNEITVPKRALIEGKKKNCGCVKPIKIDKHIGERFGKLVIVKPIERNYRYLCRCDCGNEIDVCLSSLRNGKRDCGCDAPPKPDIVGQVRGNWKIVSKDESTQNRYICKCLKCGEVKSIHRQGLYENTLSACKTCNDKKRKYPTARSRIYHTWARMKNRCNGIGSVNAIRYYANRGIKYQPSWEDFKNFYDDMKDGYADDLQLDRINPDGDYTKENCRWITAKENCRNRRDNSIVTAGGESHALAWWLEKYNTSKWSLPKHLKNDYGNDWEIKKGHRHNWLPTPRYYICAQEEK